MLMRTKIRRYLLAVLCAEDVYQDETCGTGPLWTNCDDTTIDVDDSLTNAVNENNHAPYSVSKGCAAVVIKIATEKGLFLPARLEDNEISFMIDIVVENSNSHKRQEILDSIQKRMFYRFLNTPTISDVNNPDLKYRSFLCLAERNEVNFSVFDDSDFAGDYTIRQMTFTLDVRECIKKGDCEDRPLCFNFDTLTPLNKDSDDVFVDQE